MWGSAAFFEAIHHELRRKKPAPGIFADVYDTPAWQKMMGKATKELKRIGMLFCLDGIPAFNYKVGGEELILCL